MRACKNPGETPIEESVRKKLVGYFHHMVPGVAAVRPSGVLGNGRWARQT